MDRELLSNLLIGLIGKSKDGSSFKKMSWRTQKSNLKLLLREGGGFHSPFLFLARSLQELEKEKL